MAIEDVNIVSGDLRFHKGLATPVYVGDLGQQGDFKLWCLKNLEQSHAIVQEQIVLGSNKYICPVYPSMPIHPSEEITWKRVIVSGGEYDEYLGYCGLL